MPSKRVVRRDGSAWSTRAQPDGPVLARFRTQQEAVQAARAELSTTGGRLDVFKADGTFRDSERVPRSASNKATADPATPDPAKKRKRLVKRLLGISTAVFAVIIAPIIVSLVVSTWEQSRLPEEDLAIAVQWPEEGACDATMVAAPSSVDEPTGNVTRVDGAAISREPGGGAWSLGNVTLNLSTQGERQIVVNDIHPRIETVADGPQPSWIFIHAGQCGGVDQREFALDLDKRTLTDVGVVGGPAGAQEVAGSSAPSRTADSVLYVDPDTSASIVVRACARESNYDFWLDVSYVSGSSSVEVQELGPFRVYGDASILTDPAISWFGADSNEPQTHFVCP